MTDYREGGLIPGGPVPVLRHPGEQLITRDQLRQRVARAFDVPLADVDPARLRAELGRLAGPRQQGRGLYASPALAAWSPTVSQLAVRQAADADRQRTYLARVFGVPRADLDVDLIRDEVRLRGVELDRWADDGGSFDDPLDLPPLVVEIRPDATAFFEALARAATKVVDVFRQLADALVGAGRQFTRWLGRRIAGDPTARRWPHDTALTRWRDWLPAAERKVDRARREQLERALRARARKADRRRRIRARKAAPFYAIARAGLHGAAALDVLRTAAAGAR